MILGVALVVDEFHKGHRLVFRYPEAPPSFALFSGEIMMKFHEEFMSMSPDNFARLFRPKPAFFNKIFELTIGDINYISYPAPCAADSDRAVLDLLDDQATDNVITMFTVVVARIRPAFAEQPVLNHSDGIFSSGTDPVSILMGLSGSYLPVETTVLRKYVVNFAV